MANLDIRRTIGHGLAISMAMMWAYTSQANFTSRFTPDMAQEVHKEWEKTRKAFQPMTPGQIKYAFGSIGLLAAYLLLKRSTRHMGLIVSIAAIVVGKVYPEMTLKSPDASFLLAPFALILVAAFSLGLLT